MSDGFSMFWIDICLTLFSAEYRHKSCFGCFVQMDGFDQTVNVKVIMATNRADTLDPALLRPGRLDRKIEFPLPDRRQKRLVFQVGPHEITTSLILYIPDLTVFIVVTTCRLFLHRSAQLK